MRAVFLWVYSGQDGEEEWIYTALDWNNSDNASYYVILPVLVYLGFLLMCGSAPPCPPTLRVYLWCPPHERAC